MVRPKLPSLKQKTVNVEGGLIFKLSVLSAVNATLSVPGIGQGHSDKLSSLMLFKFHRFEDVGHIILSGDGDPRAAS